MTLRAVLFPLFLVLAVICFVLATAGVSFPRVNLVALGLAFFAGRAPRAALMNNATAAVRLAVLDVQITTALQALDALRQTIVVERAHLEGCHDRTCPSHREHREMTNAALDAFARTLRPDSTSVVMWDGETFRPGTSEDLERELRERFGITVTPPVVSDTVRTMSFINDIVAAHARNLVATTNRTIWRALEEELGVDVAEIERLMANDPRAAYDAVTHAVKTRFGPNAELYVEEMPNSDTYRHARLVISSDPAGSIVCTRLWSREIVLPRVSFPVTPPT